MSSKTSKHNKKLTPKKLKDLQSSESEVFVLPPNILEKLGITLGNLQATQQSPTSDSKKIESESSLLNSSVELRNSKIVDDLENFESDLSITTTDNTSFLETAALMKESIFLSPTFVTNLSNTIPEEQEISSPLYNLKNQNNKIISNDKFYEIPYTEATTQSNNANEFNPYFDKNDVKLDGKKFENMLSLETHLVTNSAKHELTTLNHDKVDCSKELFFIDKNTISIAPTPRKVEPENNCEVNSNKRLKINDANIFSGGNAHDIENSVKEQTNETVNNNPKPNTQTIISEQIVKNLGIPEANENINNLNAVPIDQVICPKNKNEESNNETQLETSDNIEQTDCVNLINPLNIFETLSADKQLVDNSKNQTGFASNEDDITNLFSNACKEINEVLPSNYKNVKISNTRVQLSTDGTTINNKCTQHFIKSDQNSKSIVFLQQPVLKHAQIIAGNVSGNLINLETDILNSDMLPPKEENNFVSQSPLFLKDKIDKNHSPQWNTIKSKACVQGIEKPGGTSKYLENNIIKIKTYEHSKNKPIRKKPKLCNLKEQMTGNGKVLSKNNVNIDIEHFDIQKNNNISEYCYCWDYGKLSFYDENEGPYEHIHFWNNERSACNPQDIFSIYFDNVSTDEFQEMTGTNISEPNTLSLCDEVDSITAVVGSHIYNSDQSKIQYSGNHPIMTTNIEKDKSHCTFENQSQSTEIDIDDSIIKYNPIIMECNNYVNTPDYNCINVNTSDTDVKHPVGNPNVSDIQNRNVSDYHDTQEYDIEGKSKGDLNDDETHTIIVIVDSKSDKEFLMENGLDIDVVKEFDYKKNNLDLNVTDRHELRYLHLNTTDIEKDMDKNTKKLMFKKQTSFENSNHGNNMNICNEEKLNYSSCGRDTAKDSNGSKKRRCDDSKTENQQKKLKHDQNSDKGEDVSNKKNVLCGVCKINVKEEEWLEHIEKNHNFLAWKNGEATLDLESTKNDEESIDISLNSMDIFVCGVCKNKVHENTWFDHIREHNYLAWKDGESVLDLENEKTLKCHLQQISRQLNGLKCSKCQCIKKNAKSYLKHVKSCGLDSAVVVVQSRKVNNAGSNEDKIVKCGVCEENMEGSLWFEHLRKKHNYLSWRHGSPPLDLEDGGCVRRYLRALIQKYEALYCHRCNLKLDNVKSYLRHVNTCTSTVSVNIDMKHENVDSSYDSLGKDAVKCGVCHAELEGSVWFDHIGKNHNYLSWIQGFPPLNCQDSEGVREHLRTILHKLKALYCSKCNHPCKQVKSYLKHTQNCQNTKPRTSSSNKTKKYDIIVKCGVCQENVPDSQWFKHIGKNHDYLAWIDGTPPLKINDEEEVRLHLLVIAKKFGSLICSKCNYSHKYVKFYMEHIKSCNGVTIEVAELDKVPSTSESWFDESLLENVVKCALCNKEVEGKEWLNHAHKEHDYLTWIDGETELDLEHQQSVWDHLSVIRNNIDGLRCSKCNMVRKYPKSFLDHVKTCTRTESVVESVVLSEIESIYKNLPDVVNCSACKQEIKGSNWWEHIEKEHSYLATIEGAPAIDLKNEHSVHDYLNMYKKILGDLKCPKCGVARKYVRKYLRHVKTCDSTVKNYSFNILYNSSFDLLLDNETVCGVCSKLIEAGKWVKHIQIAHNYFAWQKGEEPLVLDDEENMIKHLNSILRHTGYLTCPKCGFSRRIAKAYLSHISTCSAQAIEIFEDKNLLLSKNEGKYECAICHEKVEPKKWKRHAMDKHYNVAWVVGDVPIDLKNPYGADKYLKEYQQKMGKLVCRNCGESRVSLMGFYVHIITCGKTDEETAPYKLRCDICNNDYLCIYKSQHMTMHKEQDLKRLAAEERENREVVPDVPESPPASPSTSIRRKAAVKAKSVIKVYNTHLSTYVAAFKCDVCNFETDIHKEFRKHQCTKEQGTTFSGTEDDSSSDDDDDDNGDDDDSDDEVVLQIESNSDKKKSELNQRPTWMPFKLFNVKPYLENTIELFYSENFSDQTLYPEWLISAYECLEECHVTEYLPKIETSCRVKINGEIKIHQRFEGQYTKNQIFSLFAGGAVQHVSWVPSCEPSDTHNFLTIANHVEADVPRLSYDQLSSQASMLQIWFFGAFKKHIPIFVMGIVHDYGTIWSFDWCPSGARERFHGDNKRFTRLGLLATACSNGGAYIFSVPFPDSIAENNDESEKKLYVRLKPVAELRFTRNLERKLYQATSISWSKEKGHDTVVVSYSDGTIAYYNFKNESPFLRSSENGVTIFYPYHDERIINSCISNVDTYPSGKEGVWPAVCAGGPTGAGAAGPRGAALRGAAGRVAVHMPVAVSAFTPGYPTGMLAANDHLNQLGQELEWYGCARRLGQAAAVAACAGCARALLWAPPLLRTTALFPPCSDLNKNTIASLSVKRFGKKRKNVVDDLAVLVEPSTYEEIVEKYEIELNTSRSLNPTNAPKDLHPERFPLADVTSMSFCKAMEHHEMAAVATHSGIVFVLNAH